MIIRLATADFSANNIGSVDLRTDVSLTTKAILDYYGKTWTLPQKFAIEDFLLKKEAWSFKTKIKRLVLPILGQAQAITAGSTNVKGFYDLITQAILPLTYGGAFVNNGRQIGANGLIDPTLTANANNSFFINLGTPASWQNAHYGLYYHKTRNDTTTIISNDGGEGFAIVSSRADLGSTNRIRATFDPNSISTRGLRILSYNGTNTTGLAANLPFASVTGSGAVATTGAFIPNLLNRFSVTDDLTLSLITFGDALTQSESVIYNNDIDILMSALWAV